LNAPSSNAFRKTNLFLALGFIGAMALVLELSSRVVRYSQDRDDEVQIVQIAPPPIVEPPRPRPKPVTPDPDEPHSPVPPREAPQPTPVFGIPDEATNKSGEMAVARGNTLMKPADSIVQKAPPPLPFAPVQLDKEPAILNQVIPEYPAWAEEQGITATVKLQVTIDPQGKVQSIDLVSSGGKDFTNNAIKALKATRFQPMVKDGIAHPAQFLFTYRFEL
jgi:protein TonB